MPREHRPKLIVAGASAYPREIPHGKFAEIAASVRAKLMVDMAHYAGLVAAGLHDNPVPVASDFVTTTTHKTLRGPRGGMVLCKTEHAPAVDKTVFPGLQGGPLMHVIAGKAVCFGGVLPTFVQSLQCRGNCRQRQGAGRSAVGRRAEASLSSGGTDNHLMLVDVTPSTLAAKTATQVLETCGITVNMNMIPFDTRKPMDPSGVRIGTPALTTRGMGLDENENVSHRCLDARSPKTRHRRKSASAHPRRNQQPLLPTARPG